MNFGSNAIEYGKPGGHIALTLELRDPATVRIPIEGTGIGLTITKRLAEMMKGRVGFTSEVDRGSQFWVEIPVHRRAIGEQLPVAVAKGPSPLASGTARHKIVYVEDNPSNIAFMEDLVGELPSVELVTAPTAEIGIELVRAHHPDVVIMDINLPGMSGFDAVQRLREWPDTRDIPVIGLSAAALLKDTKRASEAGFYR
jgi:CheY-like chemotaxis protein